MEMEQANHKGSDEELHLQPAKTKSLVCSRLKTPRYLVTIALCALTACTTVEYTPHPSPPAEVFHLTGQSLQFDSQLQILFRGVPDVPSLKDFDGKLVRLPTLMTASGSYPLMARFRDQQGSMVIAVLLDTSGNPVAARCLDSSNSYLSSAAVEQAMHTHWSPAEVDGAPARYIAMFHHEYKLK